MQTEKAEIYHLYLQEKEKTITKLEELSKLDGESKGFAQERAKLES